LRVLPSASPNRIFPKLFPSVVSPPDPVFDSRNPFPAFHALCRVHVLVSPLFLRVLDFGRTRSCKFASLFPLLPRAATPWFPDAHVTGLDALNPPPPLSYFFGNLYRSPTVISLGINYLFFPVPRVRARGISCWSAPLNGVNYPLSLSGPGGSGCAPPAWCSLVHLLFFFLAEA